MFSFFKVKNPCANPGGINTEEQFFSFNFIEKCFPNVFEFFRKSTATSKISP